MLKLMDGDWTSEENEEYQLVANPTLTSLYAEIGIRKNQPNKRYNYITKKILLPDECDDAEKLKEKHGRPKTLEILEKRVAEKF